MAAPLFLPLFALLPNPSNYPLVTAFLYIAVDLLSAEALVQIAQTGESVSSRLFTTPRKDLRWTEIDIGAAFLFNPFTIASCVARPTSVFTNCAILHAIAKAATGRTLTSMFALALASYLSFYPVLLFPPLVILCFDRRMRESGSKPPGASVSFAFFYLGILAATIAGLLCLSYLITSASWEFLSSTYGIQLLLPDLMPNVGLWWYFFIEMFDSFREFFLGVFWLHLASYVGGLTFRVRKQPLFVITSLIGVFAIFQPYPSISDSSLYFSLVPLYRHIFPSLNTSNFLVMRNTFFAVSALLYATFLGPAFYYLWIYAGSGNANFFYAITLVWSLAQSAIVADSLFAVLRDEWEVERPDMKGKEVARI
ncbi:MAG: hypothetical protein M1835_003240 [Candelina submexicana]|nr:MAG: hypothetical protein M1835_003240 [Candelina submexicana]